MKHAHIATAAAAALTLAGCFWPAVGAGPGRTAHNGFEDTITPATVEDLTELWSAQVEAGPAQWPVTSRNGVHVVGGTDTEGTIAFYGFDPTDGTQLWEHNVEDLSPARMPASGPMVYAGGALVAGWGQPNGGGFRTERFSPETGETLGGLDSSGHIQGLRGEGHAMTDLFLTSVTVPGLVSATVQDPDDPSQGWHATIAMIDDAGDDYRNQSMTLGEDFVYQAGEGFSRDADGEVLPTNGVRAFPASHVDECTVADTMTVACPQWFVPIESVGPPVLDSDNGIVHVADGSGTVTALDGEDGSTVWSTTLDDGATAEPALADGTLYVTTDNDLVALDAADGTALWNAPLAGPVDVQPAVAGGLVYTAGDRGVVEAFDAGGCDSGACAPLWSADTGAGITSAPAVSQGQLYVTTTDGRLVAYGLPD